MKGLEQDPRPREEMVTLHKETASVSPFGWPNGRTAFTPDRIAIETTTGAVVSERLDPRASFVGHAMNTPWDQLQRAYFNGYALWTYLTMPFLLVMLGFEVAEISPWQEGEKLWRGLRVRCFLFLLGLRQSTWGEHGRSASPAASSSSTSRDRWFCDERRDAEKISAETIRRLQVSWPRALRAVHAWLESWIMLRRYWKAWSELPPPSPLQGLVETVAHGQPLFLYCTR